MKAKSQIQDRLAQLRSERKKLQEERDMYIRERWNGDHADIANAKLDGVYSEIRTLKWVLSHNASE